MAIETMRIGHATNLLLRLAIACYGWPTSS